MNAKNLILSLLILAAAAGLGWWALRERTQAELPPTPVSFEAPPASSGAGDCYFNWSTDPLPDLSTQVQNAMQEIQAGARARAEAFGESCTYADGHSDFHTMETDFILTLQVTDVENPEALGGLIRRSMDLLLFRFPVDHTPG